LSYEAKNPRFKIANKIKEYGTIVLSRQFVFEIREYYIWKIFLDIYIVMVQ